jgi:hypothetical protein
MPLTDTQIKAFKPDQKPRKYADEKGLYLEVAPSGGKWWRIKYRIEGKEKRLSLGVYPDVGLKAARERRDEIRRLLSEGIDPATYRKIARLTHSEGIGNAFEVIAREWFAKKSPGWAASHSEKLIRRLEKDVFPWLGNRPIAEISAPDVLQVLRQIEGRGCVETAHRVMQNVGQVFRYAVATGRAQRDPTADLRGSLAPVQTTHMASITDTAEVGALLRAIEAFKGTLVVHCALKLAPLVFVRPGELRGARWEEIDLERGVWRIPSNSHYAD